jgi:hypothetical protein
VGLKKGVGDKVRSFPGMCDSEALESRIGEENNGLEYISSLLPECIDGWCRGEN